MKKHNYLLLFAILAIVVFQACKTKQVPTDGNITTTKIVEGQKNDSINNTLTIGKLQAKDSIKQTNRLKTNAQDTTVYTFAEVMPQYPGGDIEMYKFIRENIDYSNIGSVEPWGHAYVKFMVNSEGKIENIQITNTAAVPDVIEERIIEAVKKLPKKWKSGENLGKSVSVWKVIKIWEPY